MQMKHFVVTLAVATVGISGTAIALDAQGGQRGPGDPQRPRLEQRMQGQRGQLGPRGQQFRQGPGFRRGGPARPAGLGLRGLDLTDAQK